tara:strand:- start:40 stop:426 length:387 start_codon:yes stop_codon:yes gene_type:complete
MNTSNDICISCNLCCSQENETIHLFDKEYELFDVKNITTYENKVYTHSVTFKTGGCTNLGSNGECKVYDKRPRTCKSFNCGVLLNYQSGNYTLNKALHLIKEVKDGNRIIWKEEFLQGSTNEKQKLPK